MSDTNLIAELRTEFGKGGARRTRRAGKIPAVLYGHGQEPAHISLPEREYAHAIKSGFNTLLTLTIDGKKQLALTKALQRDPIKLSIDHVDLIIVKRGEKVHIEVPVILVGEAAKGGLVNHELTTLSIEAEATHLPDSVEVNIEGLEIGAHILAKDVVLPKGSTLDADPEATVVGIMQAPTAAQMEAELATAEAELGVEHQAPETPAEEGEQKANGGE